MLFKKTNSENTIDETFFALGTINNIKIFDSGKSDVIAEAIEKVYKIDDRMSAFKDTSDISKLSKNAGNGFQEIHEDTFELIKRAIEFSFLSNGAFDITIRPLF